jgi:carboxymethylenebutenolidase
MCFEFDAIPPELPAERFLAPMAGGAGAEILELVSADGTHFSAAFAESPSPTGPSVVILPDVKGLYQFYIHLAERFAEAGHHAIVIDYFGRTAGLGPRDGDFDYMPHVQQIKVNQVEDDASAALAALKERVGEGTTATVGFCLGGMLSFLVGASGKPDVDAVVGFYGILNGERFGVKGPLDRASEVKVPLLGLFGGNDAAIPVEEVEEFDTRLDESGIDHSIHIYPGAPHSFFSKDEEEFAEASEDAWNRTLDFLSKLG